MSAFIPDEIIFPKMTTCAQNNVEIGVLCLSLRTSVLC